MELVRAAALKGYFEVAADLKLDPIPLMRRAGLTRSMLVNLEQMLPARSVIQLLEESAATSGCITFGLRMAESRELADLGMISLLIVHQPTLGDALSVLSQFRNRINSTLVLRVEQFSDMALLREVFAFDPPVPCRQAEDLAIAVLDRICRSVLGSGWQPMSISFGNATKSANPVASPAVPTFAIKGMSNFRRIRLEPQCGVAKKTTARVIAAMGCSICLDDDCRRASSARRRIALTKSPPRLCVTKTIGRSPICFCCSKSRKVIASVPSVSRSRPPSETANTGAS